MENLPPPALLFIIVLQIDIKFHTRLFIFNIRDHLMWWAWHLGTLALALGLALTLNLTLTLALNLALALALALNLALALTLNLTLTLTLGLALSQARWTAQPPKQSWSQLSVLDSVDSKKTTTSPFFSNNSFSQESIKVAGGRGLQVNRSSPFTTLGSRLAKVRLHLAQNKTK